MSKARVLRETIKGIFRRARSWAGLDIRYDDAAPKLSGEIFIEILQDGAVIEAHQIKNVITLDASILALMMLAAPGDRPLGLYMLAVGTGATGATLSPDAPSASQRKLNAEVARKAFSSYVYRDGAGNASAVPTNVIDFITTFSEGEATGPLNEMGLIAPLSANPLTKSPNPDTYPTRLTTRDLNDYDILFNYLTFGVLTIPATATLRLTWRITA